MRLKSVVWLWYPTRISCGFSRSATSLTASAVFFSRSADVYTGGASDRMIRLRFPMAWLNSMLPRACRPAARRAVWWKPQALQLGGIEVPSPLGARLAERVLELHGFIAHGAERLQRAGNVGGQLLAHAPELRADRNVLPARSPMGRTGASRTEAAAAPPSLSTSRRVGCPDVMSPSFRAASYVRPPGAARRPGTGRETGRCGDANGQGDGETLRRKPGQGNTETRTGRRQEAKTRRYSRAARGGGLSATEAIVLPVSWAGQNDTPRWDG